jgi:hypothetical protein
MESDEWNMQTYTGNIKSAQHFNYEFAEKLEK